MNSEEKRGEEKLEGIPKVFKAKEKDKRSTSTLGENVNWNIVIVLDLVMV